MSAESEPAPGAYLLFAGKIDQLAVQRIFATTTAAIQNGPRPVHLLIQSQGGHIADGVCLYNYLRTFPSPISVYNVGSISSAAVTAYLGAPRRVAAPLSTFMVHRSTANLRGANADVVQARVPSLIMDDKRTEDILREHVHLAAEKWAVHATADLWLAAEEAVETGLATEIGHFAPQPGASLVNVLG